ncbi:MAG TPA: efflux RND transporter periplasmic adaptor subunit [Longimicrobiaceae bacterium]|nr:efflux RND transporter periplasmic adaptor subunit [Longimicrobiaceae bacterium]
MESRELAAGSVPVQVDTVRQGTLVLEVSATGQTAASREAAIAARVAGRVAALPYREGARVAAGAPLLRLDPGDYSLAVRQAEAELEEARARFREMTLFDDRIEDESVRRERAEAARARSGLARAEVALDRARHDLAQATVVAPFPGFVADVAASPGEFVGAGEEVLTLVDLHPILVEVQVPESELRWLSVGGGARMRFPGLPDEEFAGTIAAINPVVDPDSRTGRVTVSLANSEGTIRPGMYARVTLSGRSFADRVTVPRDALVERDGRTLVFLFQPLPDAPGEGVAKWVYVTPGLGNAREVELVSTDETPLPERGSPVIVGGNYTLVHDARVQVAEPAR